jgi:hypothetical protein
MESKVSEYKKYIYKVIDNLEYWFQKDLFDIYEYDILKKKIIKLIKMFNSINDKLLKGDIQSNIEFRNKLIELTSQISSQSLYETLKLLDFKEETNQMDILDLIFKVLSVKIKPNTDSIRNIVVTVVNPTSNGIINLFYINIPFGNYIFSVFGQINHNYLIMNTSSYFKIKLKSISIKDPLWKKYNGVCGINFLIFDDGWINDIWNQYKSGVPINKINHIELIEVMKLSLLEDDELTARKCYQRLVAEFKIKISEIHSCLPLEMIEKLKNTSRSDLPENVKDQIKEKEKIVGSMTDGHKAEQWLDAVDKIPFNKYKKDKMFTFVKDFLDKHNTYGWKNYSDIHNNIRDCNDVLVIEEWNKFKNDKQEFLKKFRQNLNSAVYGHEEGKDDLDKLVAQWIHGDISGASIGFQGPPGNGKTSIAQNGIGKSFIDENGELFPFVFIPLGAVTNGSYLTGHGFTYVGSKYGRIVEGLIQSQCMNPIFYFDELDKVSNTEQGREIINTLIHLTDSTQNHQFEDLYFAGIKLDLSKSLFIFSFNNVNEIDPILRDRLHIIKTESLRLEEKIVIGRDYLLKDIIKQIGWNQDDYILNDNIL